MATISIWNITMPLKERDKNFPLRGPCDLAESET